MITMKRIGLISVLSALVFVGCTNESVETTQVDNFNKSLEFIILEDEAVASATDFLNKGNEVNSRSLSDASIKTIWREIPLKGVQSRSGNDNETVEIPVYVVSYTDENNDPNGYVVTVGDKRVIDRVLVFADEGGWDVSEIPGFEALFWDNVDKSLTQTLSESDIDMCDTYEYIETGEIEKFAVDLFLTWGQSPSPYNDSLPACNSTTNMVAGCVAVAMGQIMAHHEYPYSGSYVHPRYNRTVNATYNWSKIKASCDARQLPLNEGRSGVANILAEAGYKVNMVYGCNVSTAYTSAVPNAFSLMGYNSTLDDFDLSIVMDNIDNEQPIYISGVASGSDIGHAWVIEGYKQIVNNLIYGRDCPEGGGESIPPTVVGYSVVSNYLYFNLGGHGASNGFYLADTFGTWHYPSYLKIVYNIDYK